MERLPTLTIHDLTERELLILRQEIENRKKSAVATWLLWLFLGEFGAHRFYLGHIGTGIAMLLTLGGLFIWWFIDIFLINGMLRTDKIKVQNEILQELAALRQSQRTPQEQRLRCPKCGASVIVGSAFCPNCGTKLT